MRTIMADGKAIEQGRGPRVSPASDQAIGQLFRAYFNNKMTLLIFLIQTKTPSPSPRLVEGIYRFLDDLYRHMLDGEAQKEYRYVFEWLKSFFHSLPEASQEQRAQAKEYVQSLYDAVGMKLKVDIQ